MVGEPTVTVNLLAHQMDMVLLGVGLFSPGKVCYNSNSFTKKPQIIFHIFAQSHWFFMPINNSTTFFFPSKLIDCSHRLRDEDVQ